MNPSPNSPSGLASSPPTTSPGPSGLLANVPTPFLPLSSPLSCATLTTSSSPSSPQKLVPRSLPPSPNPNEPGPQPNPPASTNPLAANKKAGSISRTGSNLFYFLLRRDFRRRGRNLSQRLLPPNRERHVPKIDFRGRKLNSNVRLPVPFPLY